MNDITVVDRFVPSMPSGMRYPPSVQAVTIGAGVQLHALYTYLGTQNVIVVGGSASTVGIAGGYIQGGGHSILGWLHGMASDNALEFQVVLADASNLRRWDLGVAVLTIQ
jgi:FAD/FMN-containing dehydrogenase